MESEKPKFKINNVNSVFHPPTPAPSITQRDVPVEKHTRGVYVKGDALKDPQQPSSSTSASTAAISPVASPSLATAALKSSKIDGTSGSDSVASDNGSTSNDLQKDDLDKPNEQKKALEVDNNQLKDSKSENQQNTSETTPPASSNVESSAESNKTNSDSGYPNSFGSLKSTAGYDWADEEETWPALTDNTIGTYTANTAASANSTNPYKHGSGSSSTSAGRVRSPVPPISSDSAQTSQISQPPASKEVWGTRNVPVAKPISEVIKEASKSNIDPRSKRTPYVTMKPGTGDGLDRFRIGRNQGAVYGSEQTLQRGAPHQTQSPSIPSASPTNSVPNRMSGYNSGFDQPNAFEDLQAVKRGQAEAERQALESQKQLELERQQRKQETIAELERVRLRREEEAKKEQEKQAKLEQMRAEYREKKLKEQQEKQEEQKKKQPAEVPESNDSQTRFKSDKLRSNSFTNTAAGTSNGKQPIKFSQIGNSNPDFSQISKRGAATEESTTATSAETGHASASKNLPKTSPFAQAKPVTPKKSQEYHKKPLGTSKDGFETDSNHHIASAKTSFDVPPTRGAKQTSDSSFLASKFSSHKDQRPAPNFKISLPKQDTQNAGFDVSAHIQMVRSFKKTGSKLSKRRRASKSTPSSLMS